MSVVTRNTMKPLAVEIAASLLADLKQGKVAAVGIGQVRSAITAQTKGRRFSQSELEILEELACRALVESVR